jgi:tetratricopeptide (TPR) repeat protein
MFACTSISRASAIASLTPARAAVDRSSTRSSGVHARASGDAPLTHLRPSTANRANEIAFVAAKPAPAPPVNKFQEFGRQYWPAFAALEGVALVGATVNGILSRKRREEIERLNAQMRGIMAKLDEREKTLTSEDGDSEASEALSAAKSALASDHNDRAADLFLKAIDVATRAEDGAAELSARRGYAMALAAQRKFADAASALEAYLPRSSALNQREGDSAVYGLLGDVYTDLGAFDKAGAAYDACINVMDD